MNTVNEQLRAKLHQHGYSTTRARLVVFTALDGKVPQTMGEIINTCKPRIDRASVYRTIALFESLGIVHRLQLGWKHKLELTGTFSHHHHHLTCLKCGQTTALPEDKRLEKQLLSFAKARGFTPQDHQLEIRGICKKCDN